MTTYRVAKRPRFTNIDQRTVNDNRLSFRARGLLAYLLDKPDDWTFDSRSLASASTEGRDAIRTALRELEGAGYMRRERVQSAETGRWRTVTTVFEVPPEDGFPVVGNPDLGEPGPIPKTKTKDCLSSDASHPPPRKPRKRDEIWDALTEVVGPVETDMETRRRAKCVKQLKEVGATAPEIKKRAAVLRQRWKTVSLTDTGLVGRWSTAAPESAPTTADDFNSVTYR